MGVSFCAHHFTYIILLNPMRTPQGRNYYNPHFTDEETEIQRGHRAGEQKSQDLNLGRFKELSSLPDKVKLRNVV